MICHRRKKLLTLIAGAALLLAGMGLSGCSAGVTEAQLIPAKLIETFRIRDNSFVIQANTSPLIDISDGATRYTMTSQAILSFSLLDGAPRSIFLSAEEIVIERPETGVLTVIQDRTTL
jgi:hypothetical protein